jgi:hypothetical protein
VHHPGAFVYGHHASRLTDCLPNCLANFIGTWLTSSLCVQVSFCAERAALRLFVRTIRRILPGRPKPCQYVGQMVERTTSWVA